ncbi:MAG: bifunctional aspartate kinase/homoserine dehydrogenase I [Myxococcales bacterium]|nr:bifunctional aspartate kinase/homoserine dehydrogenase I [Myxococcales bacterium]
MLSALVLRNKTSYWNGVSNTSSDWLVHKFGGTSLRDAERYRNAGDILGRDQSTARQAVVVSAMAGVTNTLIDLVQRAARHDSTYLEALKELRHREISTLSQLVSTPASTSLIQRIEEDFNNLEDLLRATWLLKSPAERTQDVTSSYGELWSAQRLALYLSTRGQSATWLDARQVLVVEPNEVAPMVNWERSQQLFNTWIEDHPETTVVITGYVAQQPDGLATTLGRNGSDYSASIFGALTSAQQITIWTDVDGVLSADPRHVQEAVVLNQLSYDEAMELSYFGAKVVHPKTMGPAIKDHIPIIIRNSLAPDRPGTRIHLHSADDGTPIKGIASINNMALVNLEGTSMIGVPGIAERLFSALREAQVSVVMISQGSSEHSICFVVPEHQAEAARNQVEQAFFREQYHGLIQRVEITRDCTVVAIVGDRMAGVPGVSGKFFRALGLAGINVRAIAQGASERNISVVVDSSAAIRTLRALHTGFYLSDQTLSVAIIGPGLVGSTLMDQLAHNQERLLRETKLDIRVRAIANSKAMMMSHRPINLHRWREEMQHHHKAADLGQLADHIQSDDFPHAVIIDMTASDDVAEHYPEWLNRGIHIVTPNKKAGGGSLRRYEQVQEAKQHAYFLYETTVGAGLPIIQTIHDLIQTGDTFHSVEGIFSGTLAYLFNAYTGDQPFSDIVREAKRLGYTEPDPRDDLSGMDVARKLVILGRETGIPISVEQIRIEGLTPQGLAEVSVAEFLERLEVMDEDMAKRYKEAQAKDEVLRFVGSLEADGSASVGLRNYPKNHPFAHIRLTDNIVQFQTQRYNDNPLIVQGPGAGPEVTAGGVFSDLLRLSAYLGARV